MTLAFAQPFSSERRAVAVLVAAASLSLAGCSAFNTVSDPPAEARNPFSADDAGTGFRRQPEPPVMKPVQQEPPANEDDEEWFTLPDTHVDLDFIGSCQPGFVFVDGDCERAVTEIDDCAGLQGIWADLSGSYRLTRDIDCTDYDSGDGLGFHPIGDGDEGDRFRGTFDGDGHVIRGLHIAPGPGDFNIGLFGFAEAALIERVGLEDVLVEGEKVFADDIRSGGNMVGALVGNSVKTAIRECFASGVVIGTFDVGGLVGGQFGGSITDSYTKAMTVMDTEVVDEQGLLAGWIDGATVQRVYSSGTNETAKLVTACEPMWCINPPLFAASFFDCEIAGDCSAPGATSTAALKSIDTYTNAGWDFDAVWGFTGSSSYPCLRWESGCGCVAGRDSDSDGLDDCADPCVSDGAEGAADDDDGDQVLNCRDPDWERPVTTCADLQALSIRRGTKHRLAADIDCTGFDSGDGKGFLPVGDDKDPFTGTLNGDGHTVQGLTILRPERPDYTGLFGMTHRATIERIGLADVHIEGNRQVGALIGRAFFTNVRQTFATGSVKGTSMVGGLIGNQIVHGELTDSYTNTTVEATTEHAGLLVGWQESIIDRCYASGTSTPAKLANTCTTSACLLSALKNSFFDCEVAGNCTEPGGRSTAEMKASGTYEAAGWDFEGVWSQETARSYPCLRWQAGCDPD